MSSSSKGKAPLATAAPASTAWASSPSLYLSYGVASLQGRRLYPSDVVAAAPVTTELSGLGFGYFAVFDGHFGVAVAKHLKERLGAALAEQIDGEVLTNNPRFLVSRDVAEWWRTTVREAFRAVDEEIASGDTVVGKDMAVGATALVALVLENYMVLTNCGFSKAVICRGGEGVVLIPEHEPNVPYEKQLVLEENTGELVVSKPLQAARGFGSRMYKQFPMAPPEVISVERELGDEFLILASDGLWESVTPSSACTFVRQRLINTPGALDARGSPTVLAKELAEHAIRKGSLDNVSVVLVLFRDFWSQCTTY